jgi:hypothetical protein
MLSPMTVRDEPASRVPHLPLLIRIDLNEANAFSVAR